MCIVTAASLNVITISDDNCNNMSDIRSSTTLSAADGRGGVLTSAGAGESQGSAATVCLKCKQSLVNIIR